MSLYHFNVRRETLAVHPTAMIRKLLCLAALPMLAVSLAAQNTAQPSNPTAEQVISNYLAARGGVDKIKTVKSERITGKVSFGPDQDGPFLIEYQRPSKMHMQFTIGGLTVIRVYDGKSSGWFYNPLTPNPKVEPMPESDLGNISDEVDFDGAFVDYKAKGNQIEFVDKEEVLGKTAYKIKLTNKRGDAGFWYFDADTNLPMKWEGKRVIGNNVFPWESYYRDFREVNGLKFPFVVESESPGSEQRQTITAEKVELNVSIDAARFGKPEPPPAPPAPAAPPTPASPDAPAQPPKSEN